MQKEKKNHICHGITLDKMDPNNQEMSQMTSQSPFNSLLSK